MAAGDFGFVGSAYTAPDPYQDSQALINWYVEYSEDDKSKTPTALLGAPGLQSLLNVSNGLASSEVRGCWVLPGGTRAIIVAANNVFMATVTVPATQTSIAQFAVALISSALLTNNGPVCIRDNGTGGYAVIVDGPYGYFVNLATNAVTQIVDPGFLGADRVAFIDGWLIFNRPGTQTFYTTGPTPFQITFPGSFFSLKDSSSDNLVTLMENERELWLIGERNSEVWYNAGGANFSFSRIPGVSPQIGCAAKHSIARLGTKLAWLGKNEQGENFVVVTNQYDYDRISNHGVETAIASYPLTSDAIGWAYEEEGHWFYVLTFPTADKTWVYDLKASDAAGKPQWHQRASFTSSTGAFHRHRGNCFMNFANVRMVGDYQSGRVHQMSRSLYTDNGDPLIALRRCPHIWSREDRKRIFAKALEIEFFRGAGLQVGQGSDPRAMMKISYDYGSTFGPEYFMRIGKVGRYRDRCKRRRLSNARDMVIEVRVSDPIRRDVVGATFTGDQEESETGM
jgi:hypothetical protein